MDNRINPIQPATNEQAYERLLMLLKILVHSPVMDDLVKHTQNPFDDLVLKLLRLLVAKP